MAIVFVTATVVGGPRATGNRLNIVRASADGGDITLRFDTTKFTSKGALHSAVIDMLSTVTDQVK